MCLEQLLIHLAIAPERQGDLQIVDLLPPRLCAVGPMGSESQYKARYKYSKLYQSKKSDQNLIATIQIFSLLCCDEIIK